VASTGFGVSLLLGNGDGGLQQATDFAAGSYPVSVAAGEFNGDDLPDLVVANYNSGDVSVLINKTPLK
jgi:hypothetical protein